MRADGYRHMVALLLEIKEPPQGIEESVGWPSMAFTAEGGHRWVEHLGRVAVERPANFITGSIIEIWKFAEQPIEFSLTGFIPAGPQLLNDRHG